MVVLTSYDIGITPVGLSLRRKNGALIEKDPGRMIGLKFGGDCLRMKNIAFVSSITTGFTGECRSFTEWIIS